MPVPFDPQKDEINKKKHGISLARAEDMARMVIIEDDRQNYGEKRYRGFGYIDGIAHCLVFTVRDGAARAISLRRAHVKEMKRYGPQEEAADD